MDRYRVLFPRSVIYPCPMPRSIEQFLLPEEITEMDGEAWATHFGNVPALLQFRNQFGKTQQSIAQYFGDVPSNFSELIKSSQFVQAEALKYWIEMARVYQDNCCGILWWNLLDGWPQCSDAIVDYFLRKKIAYSVVKCSQQLIIPVVLPDGTVWVVNNSPNIISGKFSCIIISTEISNPSQT